MLLKRMPSLRPKVGEVMPEAYADALVMFERETGRGIDDLPQDCPYAAGQVMTSDWLPPA